MSDVDRDWASRFVYDHLRDRRFRSSLTATAQDGSKPVHVALLSDLAVDRLGEVAKSGGIGNIVVPVANGAIVFDVRLDVTPSCEGEATLLAADCTMGVFLARVMEDGNSGSAFAFDGDAPATGEARLALTS